MLYLITSNQILRCSNVWFWRAYAALARFMKFSQRKLRYFKLSKVWEWTRRFTESFLSFTDALK